MDADNVHGEQILLPRPARGVRYLCAPDSNISSPSRLYTTITSSPYASNGGREALNALQLAQLTR
jgi:hypothetical protein